MQYGSRAPQGTISLVVWKSSTSCSAGFFFRFSHGRGVKNNTTAATVLMNEFK